MPAPILAAAIGAGVTGLGNYLTEEEKAKKEKERKMLEMLAQRQNQGAAMQSQGYQSGGQMSQNAFGQMMNAYGKALT